VTDAKIRQADSGEIDLLLRLVRECIEGMRGRGIDQWDDVYPDRATLERDIDEATAFVAMLQGVPVGMAVLNERQEPEYADVPWLYGGRPAVIHRLMVSPAAEGIGIARALMAHLEARARSLGFDCIRLDAFTHNSRAIRFYERSGYRRAGQVRFRKGEFHCFEKRLEGPADPPVRRTGLAPRR
jgi:ribosomal protein S18 acetylase RimI-like enzyme